MKDLVIDKITKRLLNVDNFNIRRDKGLVVYTFLAIFQPPFLPVAFIYILGLFTILWILIHKNIPSKWRIMHMSRMYNMISFFGCLVIYVLFTGLIDWMLIESKNITSTRISTFNQVTLLTGLEFLFIWTILIKSEAKKYSLRDIIAVLVLAGLIQGACAIMAFLIPTIRSYFLMFGDQELFSKEYFLLLRGYGFSINLLDTFGYGMGLIGSYLIFSKCIKNKIFYFIALCIILFTILVNARTGIVILGLGILINIILTSSLRKSFRRIILLSIILSLTISQINQVLDSLSKSQNNTVAWVASGMSQMTNLLGASGNADQMGIDEVSFIDNFIEPPKILFQYLFGTGHHVYDTKKSLGFRTDIGYLNMIWEFGIIGTSIVLIAMVSFLFYPFFKTKDLIIRKIALLNTISYGIVLMKAILIGFNPGVFVNYLTTFAVYYIISKQHSKKESFKTLQYV